MAFWPYYRAVLKLLSCGCIFFTLHSSNCHSHQWGPCKVHWTEKRHLKCPGFAFIHLHISQFVMQHEAPHSTTDRTWNPDMSNPSLSLALRFHINGSYMLFLQAVAGHWSMPYGTVVSKFVWISDYELTLASGITVRFKSWHGDPDFKLPYIWEFLHLDSGFE